MPVNLGPLKNGDSIFIPAGKYGRHIADIAGVDIPEEYWDDFLQQHARRYEDCPVCGEPAKVLEEDQWKCRRIQCPAHGAFTIQGE